MRRLASAAAGALLLSGCALQVVDVSPAPVRAPIANRPGLPGLVVAAPAAAGGLPTDAIAGEIARRTGFGLVVASAPEPGRRDPAYEQRVLETAQGPLRYYAEIHGSDGRECAGRLEIATVGVDPELGQRLRALAELIRDAHLRTRRDVQRLDVQVEPAAARVGHPGRLSRPGRVAAARAMSVLDA